MVFVSPNLLPLKRSTAMLARALRFVSVLGVLLLLGAAARMEGQVLTGEIDGTVRDSSGAVVPSATVTVTNTDQNLVERTVTTDGQGQFTAPLLTIGTYSVAVSAPGFKGSTVGGLQVHVGQPSAVPVVLATGSVSESVNVIADAISTQLDSAASSTLIDSKQVTQLSLSSRNYLQLLYIQPGISGNIPGPDSRGNITTNGQVNTQTFSVNGNGTAANGYFIDGADTLKRAGQQPVAFPGIDFIQEINLQRADYGAEFGGAGAAFVSVQTRSGATDFHGGAFGFFRSQIFNANTYFNKLAGVPRGGERYADFGYYVGGPVWIPKLTDRKNAKTFFFFGQEYLRSAESVQQNITNIPTAAQRAGNFGVPVCTVYTAGKCTATVNSVAHIDPTAQAYLTDIIDKLPLPNNPSDPQGLITQSTGFNNESQTIIRIDHQFSEKLSVFFRYLDDPFNLLVPNGFQATSEIPGVATSRITNGSTNWLGHFTYVFGANHVLEGGYSQRADWVTGEPIGYLVAANSPDIQVQLPYPSTLGQVPHLAISGSTYAVTGPYDERSPLQQIFLNNTNTLGRHTIKLGLNVELMTGGSTDATRNAGTFNFAPAALPSANTTQFDQGFANFLQGKVSTFTQANNNNAGTNRTNIYEGYFQDDFHASNRVVLTGGVRYSYFAAATEANLSGYPSYPTLNFDPATFNRANAPTLDSNGLICTKAPCAGGGTPNAAYNPINGIIIGGQNSPYGAAVQSTPTKQFAPRVGFTDDLFGNGKSALRGGFGLYYFAVPANQAKFATAQDIPNTINTTISNTTFANPGNGIPVTSSAPTVLQALQTNAPAPYSEQYSLDFQQQLFSGTVVDVGFYGNHGVHLFANIDVNQAPAGLYAQDKLIAGNVVNPGNTQVLNQIRPFPGYSNISTEAHIFTSNYNSLQATLRQQIRGGAIITASYTYAKSLSNANTPQNAANLTSEYGVTPANRAQVFNASFVYPLPLYQSQRGIVGHIVGGLETSGIISYGSGEYLTATTQAVDPGGLGLLAGGATPRPDYISNPNTGAPHKRTQWFNAAAFQNVPAGQFRPGNESVDNIVGPGYGNWDLSVYRNLKLERGFNFQLRAEGYNAFNHTNFANVQTLFGTSNFGQVTTAGPARSLQFGGKAYVLELCALGSEVDLGVEQR